jgi:hypothetical protein
MAPSASWGSIVSGRGQDKLFGCRREISVYWKHSGHGHLFTLTPQFSLCSSPKLTAGHRDGKTPNKDASRMLPGNMGGSPIS